MGTGYVTKMEGVIEQFQPVLEEQGLRGRVVSIRHLHDLQNEIESRHDQGFFNEEFYQEALSFFSFRPPEDLPLAESLIVVAVPRPQTTVSFTWNGNTFTLTIPPTYMRYWEVDKEIMTLLTRWLSSKGFHTASIACDLTTLSIALRQHGRSRVTAYSGRPVACSSMT